MRVRVCVCVVGGGGENVVHSLVPVLLVECRWGMYVGYSESKYCLRISLVAHC